MRTAGGSRVNATVFQPKDSEYGSSRNRVGFLFHKFQPTSTHFVQNTTHKHIFTKEFIRILKTENE